jgi:hypothetical protein
MGEKRRQVNITPQKTNNHIIEDLVENEGNEFSVADVRRMMVTMFSKLKEELKEGIQKQLNPKEHG